MQRIIDLYIKAYGGLSSASWMLAIIMFVNRSGSMIMPFLGVYLNKGLGYSIQDAGILSSSFGVGAISGTFLGGWLSDKIGHFKVQFTSLILGGFLFFGLTFLHDFYALAIGLFVLSTVTEMLRPANVASISYYAKPENVTRAFSLNRMAVNLGFSIGPALGGWLLLLGYRWLFFADGITCILAGIIFYFFFRNRMGNQSMKKDKAEVKSASVYLDFKFLIFVILTCMFAILFFQIFGSLPLYYVNDRQLSEATAGGLLTLNGLIVFLVEMILVYLIGERFARYRLVTFGMILVGVAYAMLTLTHWNGILYISMLVLSLAEIFVMPFLATIAVKRAAPHNRGKYMAFYALAYSTAFVIAPLFGTKIADNLGFDVLWYTVGILSVFVSIGLYFSVKDLDADFLRKSVKEENLPA